MNLSKRDIIGLCMLADMEEFRKEKLEEGEANADWVVRVCEAIVAHYTQFRSRADWIEAIRRDW